MTVHGAGPYNAQGSDPGLDRPRPAADVSVPILMWHKVDDRAPSPYWVTAAQFARQMAALKAYGYTPISLTTLYDYVTGKGSVLPPKPVVLSFDDGYQNLYTHAFPILQQYDFTAVAFIPTGKIGTTDRQDNAWDTPEAPYKADHLLWSEIEAMAATGLVAFQSHTVTHPDLEALGTNVAWELAQAKQDLAAHVHQAVDFFSYPCGVGVDSAAVQHQVRQAGYKAAVAGWGGIEHTATANVWSLKRTEVASWHDTVYDGDPRHCFMRLLDPAFPIPHITVSSVTCLDPTTGEARTDVRRGDLVRVRVTATNTGDSATVVVSLAFGNDADPSARIAERHATSPAGQVECLCAASSTARVAFLWPVPEDARLGRYQLRVTFHDQHNILGWHETGWQPSFYVMPRRCAPLRPPPAHAGGP
jgi:peptidoglycan/xylan/chitin deacetylase (PgdA/CDA1 family)